MLANPCLGDPCGAHGDCRLGEGDSYYCVCRDGYIGNLCEIRNFIIILWKKKLTWNDVKH